MPNYQRTQTITASQFDGVNPVEGMDPKAYGDGSCWLSDTRRFVNKSDWVTPDGEVFTNEEWQAMGWEEVDEKIPHLTTAAKASPPETTPRTATDVRGQLTDTQDALRFFYHALESGKWFDLHPIDKAEAMEKAGLLI